jgi:hypothetical protein
MSSGESASEAPAPRSDLDAAGNPRAPLTVMEGLALDILNRIKAKADGGYIQGLTQEDRMDIDVVVEFAAARRMGVR